jgi:hypothetical protein
VKNEAVVSSNLLQLHSVKLNYKNEVCGMQSAIQEALKVNMEKKPAQKLTPERAVMKPKIMR